MFVTPSWVLRRVNVCTHTFTHWLLPGLNVCACAFTFADIILTLVFFAHWLLIRMEYVRVMYIRMCMKVIVSQIECCHLQEEGTRKWKRRRRNYWIHPRGLRYIDKAYNQTPYYIKAISFTLQNLTISVRPKVINMTISSSSQLWAGYVTKTREGIGLWK